MLEESKPCPQSKIVDDPTKKVPQGIHDDMSKIRKILEPIHVNMPQCTEEGYPPPNEPKHFSLITKKPD